MKFSGENFEKYLEALATETGNIQYIEPLLTRIRALLSDSHINTVVSDTRGISLSDWLTDYIGDTEKSDKTVTVIDLSLVPAELIHVLTAVIARMIFESLQRYHKINHTCLPTVLVMEEAHTFVKKYLSDSDEQSADSYCCQVFEKIAREGRKFGLGLVLSSQRPSELSPTVLSQCNTFLLHRISNREDLELVKCLVPDNLRSLLHDLPSLPSQNAILLGWATELPVLVKMNTLPKEQQPLSDDPDFWDVWTGTEERAVDWEKISEDWQQNAQDDSENVHNEEKVESAEQDKAEGKGDSGSDTGFPEDIPF